MFLTAGLIALKVFLNQRNNVFFEETEEVVSQLV